MNDNHEVNAVRELTAQVVAAYVSHNPVPANKLPDLIGEVHSALAKMDETKTETSRKSEPAVNPKRSVTDDYIICLEDGQKFRSLKRHLMTHYGLTPDEYRQKWGLASDYPMVAPNYSDRRSRIAKEMGLGRKPGYRRRVA